MLTWLLLGTLLYLMVVFLPACFLLPTLGLKAYVGSRDSEPERGPMHGRSKRVLRNFQETYPVFIAVGILALILPEADLSLAVKGAAVFVLARLVYVPLYLFAVPLVRSLSFLVAFVGLLMMGLALV